MAMIRRIVAAQEIKWPDVSSIWLLVIPAGVVVVLFKLAISDGGRHAPTLALAQMAVLAAAAFRAAAGRMTRSPLLVPVAAMVVAAAITSLWSVRPDASVREILLWLTYASITLLVSTSLPGHHAARRFVDAAVVIGGWLALIGLFTFWGAGTPGMRWYSTFYWPNPFAAFLLLLLPIELMRMLLAVTSRDAAAHGALAALLAVPFVLTYSRGAWISLAAVVPVAALVLRPRMRSLPVRRLVVLVLVVAAVVTGLTMGSGAGRVSVLARAKSVTDAGDYSLQGRLNFWRAAGAAFGDHPLTGTGPGTFGAVHARYQRDVRYYARDPHSLYLQIAAEMGIAGILAGAVLLWSAARLWLRVLASSAGRPEFATIAGLGIGLGAFSLHSGLDMNWMFPANPAMAFALIGVLGWYGTVQGGTQVRSIPLGIRERVAVCAISVAAIIMVNVLQAADSRFTAGGRRARAGDWSGAAVLYAEAIRLNPLSAKSYGAASAEAAHRQPPAVDLAAAKLHRAMALDRMNATYPIQLARLFMDHPTPDRLRQAEILLKKAIDLDQWNRPEAYRLLARLLRRQDRNAEAAAVYRRSAARYLGQGLGRATIIYILLWPEVAALGIDAAEFLAETGARGEARSILAAMLAEDPENARVRAALIALDERP